MLNNVVYQIQYILFFIIFLLSVIFIIAILGGTPFLGCYKRYSESDTSSFNTKTATINANGKLSDISCAKDDQVCMSSNPYGQWLNVGLDLKKGSKVTFEISGEVSLCQGFYAGDNKTLIPRVDNQTAGGLPIVLDSKVMLGQAKNLTEVFVNDKLQVIIGANASSNPFTVPNFSSMTPYQADCTNGKTSYNPICGKYSFYNGMQYAQSCDMQYTRYCVTSTPVDEKEDAGYTCYRTSGGACCSEDILGCHRTYKNYNCSKYVFANLSQPYSSSTVFFDGDKIDRRSEYNPPTLTQSQVLNNICPVASNIQTWFTFDKIDNKNTASGLTYSISGSSTIKNLTAEILEDCPDPTLSFCHKFSDRYILDEQIQDAQSSGSYLQYNFFDIQKGPGAYNGGYVVYLKQTKCYRQNGSYLNDSFDKRGQIKYLLLDGGEDPNISKTSPESADGIDFDINGKSTSNIISDQNASLWVLINNKSDDYQNSTGSYNLVITQEISNSSITKTDMWSWICDLFIKKWQSISRQMFQNLICYQSSDQSSCTNLFKIIDAFLIGYLMIVGMMFSIGMLKMNQVDLAIRVTKVVIVGGLFNENTYNFFNTYIFNLVYSASDEIMGSLMNNPGDLSTNLDNFFSQVYGVLGAEVFQIQMLAMLGTGMSGIIFFIIIVISLFFFLVAIFEFIVVYLMSSLAISILLSLAPIFLTFMLFETTRYLFDNWIKFTLKYIFEPVILFAGLTMLTQLFLIYLDYILGFSVCWKCNMPFQVPFLDIFFPFLQNLKTVPIFCIYWLAPWGYDPISYNFVTNMTYIAGLFTISFSAFKYAHITTQITRSIFGDTIPGGSAAQIAGSAEQAGAQGLKELKSSNNKPPSSTAR
jgi:type IV secretion system protein VirB6